MDDFNSFRYASMAKFESHLSWMDGLLPQRSLRSSFVTSGSPSKGNFPSTIISTRQYGEVEEKNQDQHHLVAMR